MRWRKLGWLFACENIHPKLLSHAANPLAMHLKGDIYRVYYGGRDHLNRTSVGVVDIDIDRQTVLRVGREPVFEFGPEGSFYSHGVSIGSTYTVSDQRYILFMGWHVPPREHWRGEIGRLRVESDGSLVADPEEPLLARSGADAISLSYPWVVPGDGKGYKMWYGSTISWDAGNGEMIHVFRQARSRDGVCWRATGRSVPFEINVAQAFSRPTISVGSEGALEMWFSYRSGTGASYRIGYAKSEDGDHWELDLESAGIDVSDCGWDSEMIEYPFVFKHRERQYMLYNGNGYGKTGFGLAVRED